MNIHWFSVFQLVMWINQNFLLQEDVGCDSDGNLNLAFMSLRGSGPCHIKMDTTGTVSGDVLTVFFLFGIFVCRWGNNSSFSVRVAPLLLYKNFLVTPQYCANGSVGVVLDYQYKGCCFLDMVSYILCRKNSLHLYFRQKSLYCDMCTHSLKLFWIPWNAKSPVRTCAYIAVETKDWTPVITNEY